MIKDLLRTVFGLAPGVGKINADLGRMRQLCKPVTDQLIPWVEEKEFELLSLNSSFPSSKKSIDNVVTGSLLSIYYEPMVTFAFKSYVKGQRDALLYIRTSGLEFVYRLKRKDTDIYFNSTLVAMLDDKNILHGIKSKTTLGSIKPYSADLLSIIVQGRDVGHMFNPARPHSEQQRAFFVLANLSEEDEYIVLALGLYELVMRTMSNKKKK